MRLARNGRVLLITAFCFFVSGKIAGAQNTILPLARLSRIVLLPLPEPVRDPRVLEALVLLRGGKKARIRPPANALNKSDKFNKLQKGKSKAAPPPPPLTMAQTRTIARVLFREILAERLRTGGKFAILSDDAVRDALNRLPFAPKSELTPTLAGRLAAKLEADAVLAIDDSALTLPADESKTTTLRVNLRLFGPRLTPEAPMAEDTVPSLLENRFTACGTAEKAVSIFGKVPPRVGTQGAGKAARQAALRAAHTLRTGEILLLCLPNVTVALAPVPSPSAADRLLFAANGRTAQTEAVRNLPPDVSGLFLPDLAPLSESAVIPAYRMRKSLFQEGLNARSLWTREDDPQIGAAQRAAKALPADYVLMATVSELDVDAGLEAGAATMTWLAQGRAEAVGVLLRVSDGAVLWRDRCAVSLESHADRSDSFSTARQEQAVARDAVKFALLELQRRFHRYVGQFEK